jgi:hypothetical protein
MRARALPFRLRKKDFPLFCFEPSPFRAFGGALCFAAMALYGQISPFFSLFTPSISNFLKITIVFTAGVVVYLLYILVLMRASMHKSAKKEKGGKYYAEKKQTIAPRENS